MIHERGRGEGFEEHDELERAVCDCIARMEDSGLQAIEELARERPELSDGLRRRMRLLLRTGLLEEPAERGFPERLGDFRLLSPLGGGGMGTVYLARQESLGREVALKVVRADLLFFPDARLRFQREAEVVARLEHPGIVPVHAVGEEGGVPFLAMARVRGATLAEIVDELGGRTPAELSGRDLWEALCRVMERKGHPVEGEPPPLFTGTWPEACVALAEQVALALDHAHRHGVLHRDVKPSNVLLSADGRAQLFDFGLAHFDGATEITATGTPVGSLPYMAPEQISGGSTDRRTDVYGLGLALCELLTLTRAFTGRGELELRRAVLAGDLAGVRQRNPAVPLDFESVCLKAVDRDPQRRYASAAELARDLRNLLELRPVTARPAGWPLRAQRWIQRHPARAVALAAALLMALGGPTVVAIQRELAARRVAEALAAARAEGERAERNLDSALEAVVTMLGEVGDDVLADVPGMSEERARLLGKSVALFDELAPQRPGDQRMEAQRGRLLRELASALDLLGRDEEALAAYEQSVELLRAPAASGRVADVLDLAGAIGNLAGALTDRGQLERALALETEVLTMLEPLSAGRDDPVVLRGLLTLRRNHVMSLQQAGDLDAALKALEPARDVAARLARVDDSLVGRTALASVDAKEFMVHYGRSDPESARTVAARAFAVYAPLCSGEEVDQTTLYDFGSLAANYATVLGQLDRHGDQEEVARAAIAALERLVREHPHVLRYRKMLGAAIQPLALSLIADDRREAALPLLTRSMQIVEELAASRPTDLDLAFDHAVGLSNLASVNLELERFEEARALSQRAVDGIEACLSAGFVHERVQPLSVIVRLVRDCVEARAHRYPDPDQLEALARERAPEDAQVAIVLSITMAVALESVGSDPNLGSARRGDLEELYTERALVFLERALDLGYSSAVRLAETRELDVLRDLPEFQRLAARLR